MPLNRFYSSTEVRKRREVNIISPIPSVELPGQGWEIPRNFWGGAWEWGG